VNFSADNEIYPLIDMQQDFLKRKICGEGVPDWAAQNNFNFLKSMQFPWYLRHMMLMKITIHLKNNISTVKGHNTILV
jgi:hypothetical protein